MKQLKLMLILTLLLSGLHSISAQVGKFIVSAPASVAGDYNYVSLPNGWGVPATGLCGELVLMLDSTGTTLGCLPTVSSLTGKIAFVERGTCGFSAKVLAAQNAGAIGVIIGNNASAVPGALGGGIPQVTIPSAMISNADGVKLKAELLAGGTVVTGCMSLPDVKVSFTVDMKGQTVDPTGVFLGYQVEGGAPNARPMVNQGGGIYTDTLSVPATSEITYIFVNGAVVTGAEVVPAACSVNSARYVFSSITGGDLPKVCFGACTLCENNVTLRVDMKLATVSPLGLHVAGNFQGWNPASTPMTNAGNGIWTYTFAAKPGDSLQYKFINGNAFGMDEQSITAACGTSNGFGGFNRLYVVPNEATTVLPAVCFDSCGACPSLFLECDPGAIICDGFDTYTVGGINAQSAIWDTWDGTGGDGIVSIDQAKSGTQSLKIDFAVPAGTPAQDVVLLLGDSTKGNYLLKWKMYIPSGKKAYFNIQHDLTPHVFGSEVYFDANGAGRIIVGGAAFSTFKYQYDKWITVDQNIDISNNVTYLRISDTLRGVWNFDRATDGTGAVTTSNQLAGVNFYPADATYKFYVDDVQFVKLAAGIPSDFCLNAADINVLFGKAVGTVQSSTLYNNTGAGKIGDPATGWSCFGEPTGNAAAPSLENTVWFTFKGDGNAYLIETAQCNATAASYINDGDTQMAIYEGANCGVLTPVLCNEDGPSATGTLYPAGDTLQTVVGKTYFMMVDGFAFNGAISDGEFCVSAKRMPPPARAVTFQVDMSQVTLSPMGAYIAGEFNNWTGQPMTSAGAGIWRTTINLPQGDTIEYKFQNGPGGWENNLPTPCGFGTTGNRSLIVPATVLTTPNVCFNSCLACTSSTSDVTFNSNINIAPNPTSGTTTVMVSLPESTDLTVKIMNSLGQLVESRIENGIQTGNIRLEMARYGKGIYFVELTDGVNRATRRVVVQ